MTHSNNTQKGKAMSKEDRLLSDEELRKRARIAVANSREFGDYSSADEESVKGFEKAYEEMIDSVVNLVNTQKRLYAESIIGEDEPETHEMYAKVSSPIYRNELRAEQRARIK